MQPTFSIVMSVFNGGPYLAAAINSVLEQTFYDFEFIIVNDGSTDETGTVLQAFKDVRIRHFKLGRVGIAKALNYGLEKASGKFIARIDADDLWEKKKLETQYNYLLDNPEVALVATTIEMIDRKDKHLRFVGEGWLPEQLKNKIYQQNVICHSSVVYRAEVLETVGHYNEKYKNSLDYDYWIRILKYYDGCILPQPLTKYRLTLGMLSIKKRYQQNLEVFTIKLFNYRECFQLQNLKYIIMDIYRLLIPDFVIRINKKLRKKEL